MASRKVLILSAIAFVCLLIMGSGRRVQTAHAQTLRAFYTAPVIAQSGLWIAKEVGFFKKQGIDVNVLFIGSGPTGTAAILSGEVDVGRIGGFAPIRAVLGGAKDLVIIGETSKYITASIVGKKEIAGVQDLKGKRLGIDRIGSNPDMYTIASLARFQIDRLPDLQYIQLGDIGQGVPALKAGVIDAVTTNPPHDLFAQRLGFKVILDITAMKIPFAATVLISARSTVDRKQPELMKFMRAYAEAVHYFLTNLEGTSQIITKYTKVQDRDLVAYSIQAESQAMDRALVVDPEGISFVLGQIKKTVPQAASAKPEDFFDPRFFTELQKSGFLKSLWGEH